MLSEDIGGGDKKEEKEGEEGKAGEEDPEVSKNCLKNIKNQYFRIFF